MKLLYLIKLWFTHLDDYAVIYKSMQRDPAVYEQMREHPGVKFMRHGYWIVIGIIFWLYFLGC